MMKSSFDEMNKRTFFIERLLKKPFALSCAFGKQYGRIQALFTC
ncbi:TPA: hypothetical protein ACGG3U_001825 [Legionella pneumophila]|nr:hypothetical protein [Legionella pneumophila]AGH52190.1 hypothetical protein LPE509_00099 [Legionella pneumophila subsp. pneumophila LPE509]MCW8390805.1 hypothetical protein [Legionella pneumophila]MCW8439129.1 hypothetical protein [Legionella pneumophila]MCW8481550.1 hypothetical protein [Legionella pneumophila]MCW8493098.1 hypothetical protein [Legionella pneumophila]